ncbi:diguanylate cyclase [Eubacteriaceae bacterium ES3]|nr:diguanylate cyclase [Eubacteriaceae bacterium ES3]
MNVFFNLPENARNDFYQAKYNYYRHLNLGVLTLASLLYFLMVFSDWKLSGTFLSLNFLLRFLFVIPLSVVFVTYYKTRNFKIMSVLSFATIHTLILGNILISYVQFQHSILNEVFLITGFVLLLASFSTPVFYAVFANLMLVGDFFLSDYLLNLETSASTLLLFVLTIVVLSGLTIIFAQFYYRHYITERKLAFALIHDPLTKVFNRRKLDQLMGKSHDISFMSDEIGVLVMDIDNFKSVNDNYGHDNGDRILQFVADCIRNSLRGSDLVIRWGGEEFAAILFDCPADQVVQVAERIRNAVERSINGICPITISIGTALYTGGDCLDSLKNANQALKDAKDNGRNLVVPYSPEIIQNPSNQ